MWQSLFYLAVNRTTWEWTKWVFMNGVMWLPVFIDIANALSDAEGASEGEND